MTPAICIWPVACVSLRIRERHGVIRGVLIRLRGLVDIWVHAQELACLRVVVAVYQVDEARGIRVTLSEAPGRQADEVRVEAGLRHCQTARLDCAPRLCYRVAVGVVVGVVDELVPVSPGGQLDKAADVPALVREEEVGRRARPARRYLFDRRRAARVDVIPRAVREKGGAAADASPGEVRRGRSDLGGGSQPIPVVSVDRGR